MFKSSFIAAIGAAIALTGFGAAPAAAQSEGSPRPRAAQPPAEAAAAAAGRTRRQGRNSAPAAPTPEENLAAAQALATGAGLACQATEATLSPLMSGESRVYEAACATGPGYILIASTPPQGFDCVQLAATQARLAAAAAANPAAAPAPATPGAPATTDIRCALPQNLDVLRVMVDYAREANLPCVPNEGNSLSKQIDGEELYEVGCDGVDGYLLQKLKAGGWKATECSRILEAALACQFTTPAEKAASLKARFAGNAEAAACDVTQSRYMGTNANGSFYEAKCAADNGIIVRMDSAYAVQRVYPCEVAQRIGGGCTLTIVPPLPEGTVSAPAQ
ncbi:hypothetical protein BZG35_06630 [Brevundimonas sp. LM2]|uniref:hypothetical protein n=1 Tax=Brevundimonas sp. LM2 TaxID=1938605 RepID=UPI000983CCBF|nr:hypothetical protein [Brevundimonas sp. LM2]AQR61364.1 hypothetical protein BZG35_06630 [Brevundimonas sp. LM2]